MSAVPLTVIKGAGFEHIPLPSGQNATTADFHTIRTKTDSPAHITSGFYKIEAGPARPAQYNFEESKYVLSGQVDVLVSLLHLTHPNNILTGYRTRLLASPTTSPLVTLPSSTLDPRSSSLPSLRVSLSTSLLDLSAMLTPT